MNISKLLILLFFLSSYLLDDTVQNKEPVSTENNNESTQKNQENQKDKEQSTNTNESGQNTSNQDNKQQQNDQQKTNEQSTPEFVDQKNTGDKKQNVQIKKKNENSTELLQQQLHKLEYNRDYKKDEIMITQLNAPLEFEKPYYIKKSGTILLTKENTAKTLIVKVLNFNKMRHVKIVMVKEQEIITYTFSDLIDDLYIPISVDLLQKFEGGYIELITEQHFHNIIFLQQVDTIQMTLNTGVKLRTDLCDQILFTITYDNTQKDINNRYQFILQSDLAFVDLKGDENLDFFVNKSLDHPTTQKYDFKSTGNIGQGLIKSINHNSKFFCNEDKCEYTVLVLSENINSIALYFSEFKNNSVIKFRSNMHMIEELEGEEQVTYEINIPSQKYDWIFAKDPSKGDIKFYVNPNIKPDNLEDYKYKGIEKGQEEMIISAQELKKNNENIIKFFVTFVSDDSKKTAVFLFQIYRINKYSMFKIPLNTYQTGVINPDEIINYKLQFQPQKETSYSIDLQLISYYGNSDIYVKSCMYQRGCTISKQDIKTIKKQQIYNKNQLTRFSESDIALKDGTFMDQILLQFNCPPSSQQIYNFGINDHSFNKKQKKDQKNNLFNSQNCTFSVAVHNRDQSEGKQSMFKLIAKGQGELAYLKLGQAQSLKLDADQQIYLNTFIDKNENNMNKFILVKAISLIGSCQVYMSTNTDKPNNSDNEQQIQFERKNVNSIHTLEKKVTLPLKFNQQQYINLAMQVISEEYCVVEIQVDVTVDPDVIKEEKIIMDQLYHRQLTREQIFRKNSLSLYYYNFYYKFDTNPQQKQTLQITLNSIERNLLICVQKDTSIVDFTKKCDYSSESNTLELTNLRSQFKVGSQLAISVYLKQEKNEFEILPLEFILSITSFTFKNNLKIIQLFIPGIVFTTKINPNDTQVFSINFAPINYNGFVALTTSHIGLTASLTTQASDIKNLDQSIAQLDHSKFAFIINEPEQIKWQSSQKHLYIVVKNASKNQARFSLVYTYDDQPIKLIQDADIFLPSDQDQYFLFEEKGKKQNVNINFGSDGTKFETFGKVVDEQDLNELKVSSIVDSIDNDYKSDLSSRAELFVLQEDFRKYQNPYLCILYSSKNQKVDIQLGNTIVNLSDKLVVSVSVGAKQIYPFEYVKDNGQKDEFKYYYFMIDEPSTVLINLVIDSGESDLYISKGQDIFPNKQKYWKRSATDKGDEIVIKPEDFNKQEDMIGVYTIGVFSREYSRYELVYAPDFDSVYQVKFQQILNLNLKSNKDYFLHFHNKHDNFHTFLYAEDDVKVDVLDYKEQDKFDFLSYILDEKNYSQNFDYYKGGPPRIKFIEDAYKDKEFFVIKLNSRNENSVVFTIYDNLEPLQIHGEKRFHFSLDTDEVQVFQVDFDNMYETVHIDTNLKFGSIKFSVTTIYDKFEDWEEMNSTNQVYKEKIFDNKDSSENIVVFNTVYIKVIAKELSYFSILVKPKNKYKQLKKFETEIIYTSKEMDQYLFFQVNKNDLISINSLQFNLNMIQSYLDNPELYFVANNNFSFNQDMPFIPMPIKDIISKDFDELRSIIITPYVQEGFYLFKILKNEEKIPIKISITINNQKNLELNGVRKELIPINKSKQYFTVYAPQAGRLRIALQTCQKLVVTNFIQIDKYNKFKYFDLNKLYFESLNYMQINDNGQSQDQKQKRIIRNLFIAFIDKPGLIQFEVQRGVNNEQIEKYNKIKNPYYDVITEFQPKSQELVFKDYVKITSEDRYNDKIIYRYQFVEGNLILNFVQPQLKSQFKVDFPNIKKVSFQFNVLITGYDSTNGLRKRIKECGISAIETINKYTQQASVVYKENKFSQLATIQMIINKDNLHQFHRYNFLEIFVYVNINFIENEEDQYGITLNRKFVQVPYFDLVIPNNNSKVGHFLKSLFGILIVGFFVFIFFAVLQIRRRRVLQNDIETINMNKENDDVELQKVKQEKYQVEQYEDDENKQSSTEEI